MKDLVIHFWWILNFIQARTESLMEMGLKFQSFYCEIFQDFSHSELEMGKSFIKKIIKIMI